MPSFHADAHDEYLRALRDAHKSRMKALQEQRRNATSPAAIEAADQEIAQEKKTYRQRRAAAGKSFF